MIKRILIFSFTFIGDAILSTAVIQPLRRRFPEATISFLVGKRALGLLSNDPQIDEVIVYDNKGKHAGLNGKIRLIRALWRERFDLVVDLRDSLWSRFIGGEHWGITQRGRQIHAVTRYLNVLQRHGVNTAHAAPRLEFTAQELQAQTEFLGASRIDPDRSLIGIHPGGNWVYKLWRPGNFAQLADRLSEKWNAQILLFAGPEEQSLQMQVANLMRRRPIIVKGLHLRQVAALIAACDIYIGNDTGPMHIAAAVGTPVVAIFASTNHRRSGPYGKNNIVVQSDLNLGCNPCHPGRRPGGCGAGRCAVIEAITVAQLFSAVEKLRSD